MTPNRVTIEDVAAEAGVSVATVSRALRGLPNVAPGTRERVLATAAAMSYEADPNASRLAAGRSRTVAMAVPVLNGWYFAQVVAGVEAVLSESGYDLLLFGVTSDASRTRFLSGPLRRRSDGLILVDIRIPALEIESLATQKAQLVTVGFQAEQFPSVRIDDLSVARSAVAHLVGLGHTSIAIMAGLPDDPLRFTVPELRRQGYLEVLEEVGVAPREEFDVAGNFSIDGGYEAMAKLLDLDDPPTAVFAMSDEMAMGALVAARERGVDVPGDLSVIGVDDHDAAAVVGLTTVAQAVSHHGSVAARLLLDRFEDPDAAPVHHCNATKLVVRSTTGPPRDT